MVELSGYAHAITGCYALMINDSTARVCGDGGSNS